MEHRVYIDTLVIGGCFDEEFNEWSNKLFDDFKSLKRIAVILTLLLMSYQMRLKMFKIILN